MTEPLPLRGCRHDILGHYLKAVGLLRVLARCADKDHCDPDAEGWWDLENACFCLLSSKYPTRETLVEFFEKHYQPTPFFSPWNTGGGLDDKQEVVVTFTETVQMKGGKSDVERLIEFLNQHKSLFADAGLDVEKKLETLKKKSPRNGEFGFTLKGDFQIGAVTCPSGIRLAVRQKTSGKKAVMAELAKLSSLSSQTKKSLEIGRSFFSRFSADDAEPRTLLEDMRDTLPSLVVESLDAVLSTKAGQRAINNPLFLNRGMGEGGNDEMFRQFWVLYREFKKAPKDRLCAASLMGQPIDTDLPSELGFPFFPDAIKSYNQGGGWVQHSFKFNPLDYLLAMEGAFAMRGSVARQLGARSNRFAAFPFVFETGDFLTEGNDIKRTASALWLPFWTRRTTCDELSNFIGDAQARLPDKDARFSAEFVRALYSQGVDAGFTGWQEFRFKLKVGRVPWVTSGPYVESAFCEDATRLNRALQPLDESYFLDQFDPFRDARSGKLKKDGPHVQRETINDAMEGAIRETTPRRCLGLLHTVFAACRKMTISKTFRDMLPGKRARFFQPLPIEDWNALFAGFDEPEFRIARAVASIVGQRKQADGKYSEVLPMLGSLLPLKLGKNGWYLPSDNRSYQAVWTGTDVCRDLAAVLARRYLDSLRDDQPALVSDFGAALADVLAFLRGELDDHLIGRWIEALSLIGWQLPGVDEHPPAPQARLVPMEYTALRVLLELECEQRKSGDTTKRRSQQPIALLCQRSASTLPLAVTEALRWISIWGVRNPDPSSQSEKERLAGRDIIRISPSSFHPTVSATRLAAAVCIPVHWSERNRLFREISVPQANT